MRGVRCRCGSLRCYTRQYCAYTDGCEYAPERVAYDEQRHVFLVCTVQDLVCLCLDHVTVCDDDLLLVECFLSYLVVSWSGDQSRSHTRSHVYDQPRSWTYQSFLIHHQYAGVRLEVDTRRGFDRLLRDEERTVQYGTDDARESTSSPRMVMSFSSQRPSPMMYSIVVAGR